MNITKIYASLILLVTMLSVAGYTYAHWTDLVRINGSIEMAHILIDIKSEKALMSRDVQQYSSLTYEVSPDRHTLSVHSINIQPCWYIWVGLVLQNQGTLPGKVKPPEYTFEGPDGFEQYFETKEYFYGVYPENTGFGNLEEWGKVKIEDNLKSDGSVAFETTSIPTPFPLNPTEKAVVWIWIHCKLEVTNDAQGQTVILNINIVDDISI
jgi:hypothetical protein